VTAVHNINNHDDDVMHFKLLFNVTFLVCETENQMLKTSTNLPLL